MELKIGVSTCLLGKNVRFDGGHQLDRWITEVLGRFAAFAPVCPEVEAGLSIPRESMRLVGDPARPGLIGNKTGRDYTRVLEDFCARRLPELEHESLCGFIFKSKSPSSGMERVKVYNDKGMPAQTGVGIFAREFMRRFPLLPCEEDGRLKDPILRENFIERVFTMRRWRALLAEGPDMRRLIEFHTRHKLLILGHSQKHYREMGRLVAQGRERPFPQLLSEYQSLLMAALAIKSNPRKQLNVLQHAAGYFKRVLTADEKKELNEIFMRHADGLVPLIVPMTILNHHVRKHGDEYLAAQVWLNPHPVELKLRNHV